MRPPPEGALELAQARLSARFGSLPDDALWARLSAIRDHAILLDAMRTSVMARWVRGIVATDGAHRIECAVRVAWREEVRQVAAWMPPAWQQAVHWWTTFLDLPLLQHLGRGGPMPCWLAADPAYRETDAPGTLRDLAPWRLARKMVATGDDAPRAWLAAWRVRCADPDTAGLDTLARLLRIGQPLSPRITSSSAGIASRRRALTLLFRHMTLEPMAAFCYLAIVAIELERLRGELVRSVLFARERAAA